MFTDFKRLLIVMLLLSCVLPAFSFEPSGGVLMLDGEDDYAILPFAEHGYIIPADAREFTVEVWFYPKAEPEQGVSNIILSQQVRFRLKSSNCRVPLSKKDQVCSSGVVFLEGGGAHGIRITDAAIKKDQWNYMAVIFTESTVYLAYNDQIRRGKKGFMNVVAGNLRLPEGFKNFCVGGYAEDVPVPKAYFHGEIDAIRFSNIARYDLPAKVGISPFDPPRRLSSDAHTLALWDFNDKEGADRFKDTSGNEYTLFGMNGATTSRALAVNPANTSTTTTWGKIKSE